MFFRGYRRVGISAKEAKKRRRTEVRLLRMEHWYEPTISSFSCGKPPEALPSLPPESQQAVRQQSFDP